MKEVKIADKNHPDYKEFEKKASEYKKQFSKNHENLKLLNLPPKEEDRQFCIMHRKFMEKMKKLDKEYEQIYTKSITEEEFDEMLNKIIEGE